MDDEYGDELEGVFHDHALSFRSVLIVFKVALCKQFT